MFIFCRSDSDIYMPYGKISLKTEEVDEREKKEDVEEEEDEKKRTLLKSGNFGRQSHFGADKTGFGADKTGFGANKTGFAAWFVSNCQTVSHRERLVEELQSYLPPDSIHVGYRA